MDSTPLAPRSRVLTLLAGSLAALLGLGTQQTNAAPRPMRTPVPRPTRTPVRRPTHTPLPRPTATTPTATMPPATGAQRGHWEYAVYQLQTYKAARYQSFFTQLGAKGWELVGQSAYASPGSPATDTLLVTFKRPR